MTPSPPSPSPRFPPAAELHLETFAFGGPEGCSPCFDGGYTGIPVRLSSGELVQGMVGAPGFEPGPSATPDGYIAEDLSANGEHLIFGSTSRFAQGGNDETGDVSIYDRNLLTARNPRDLQYPRRRRPPRRRFPACRELANAMPKKAIPTGSPSSRSHADGNRILLGQKVSEDADGNVY